MKCLFLIRKKRNQQINHWQVSTDMKLKRTTCLERKSVNFTYVVAAVSSRLYTRFHSNQTPTFYLVFPIILQRVTQLVFRSLMHSSITMTRLKLIYPRGWSKKSAIVTSYHNNIITVPFYYYYYYTAELIKAKYAKSFSFSWYCHSNSSFALRRIDSLQGEALGVRPWEWPWCLFKVLRSCWCHKSMFVTPILSVKIVWKL